jgi:hypothetical protein
VRLAAPQLRQLPARHAALETRRDRDALGALVRRDAVSVFVVASLRDVDDPRHHRLGVCWRPKRYAGVRLIILTPDALATTLAHELGHYLGNSHTRLRGNLMSYRRAGGEASLTPAQVRQLRAEARRVLREVSSARALSR